MSSNIPLKIKSTTPLTWTPLLPWHVLHYFPRHELHYNPDMYSITTQDMNFTTTLTCTRLLPKTLTPLLPWHELHYSPKHELHFFPDMNSTTSLTWTPLHICVYVHWIIRSGIRICHSKVFSSVPSISNFKVLIRKVYLWL